MENKAKADLLNFDYNFEGIIMFGNILVLETFQFWQHFSFDAVLVTFSLFFL